MKDKIYLCIDLKSFYASVECIERNLDPMTTNLVVADNKRTEKTICLAVSPSLKSYGIPGRPRLFEVVSKVKAVNRIRENNLKGEKFSGESYDYNELKKDKKLKVSYITATPRMAHYISYSTRIYEVYLKYIAPEDIHVYSIDEVFIDMTNYLDTYKKTAKELAMTIIRDVLSETGITATAGIGTNMYLAKIAMDIVAKKMKPDKDGVRIAYLNERLYREKLWSHMPITDFWRVGKGYYKKLEKLGLETMGDIARASLNEYEENKLYKVFGVNAELLIDHAWGWEPCTIKEVKEYKPESKSIGSGQVLQTPYSNEKARLIIKEMAELLALDLVDKGLVTNQIVLTIGYDVENISGNSSYKGEITVDNYGRKIPKHGHGTVNLLAYTSSTKIIVDATLGLFLDITDKNLSIRRINISANNVIDENSIKEDNEYIQLDLFTDYNNYDRKIKEEKKELKKEKRLQKAMLSIRKKHGKNAILKGNSLEEGATTINRNNQIGGHRA